MTSMPADLHRLDDVQRPEARAALTAAVLAMFVVTLDAVIVNVALPTISRDFDTGISGLQWVVDGYTLPFAALLLWSGALTDRIGARRVFSIGVALFVVASVACGAAPTLGTLVLSRLVQGAAAALMMPASMAMIGQAYPDHRRRARAIGIWAAGGAVASSSGPVLGGLLTLVSWRYIFFVNVPVGIVAVVLARRAATSPSRRVPFDWVGQATAIVSMTALTYGAIETGVVGVTSPQVLVALAVAAAAAVAFVRTERRTEHPMVPLKLFRERNVSVSVAVGFAFVAGYYGLPFVMSLYLQDVRGLSAFEAGLTFLPMMLSGGLLLPAGVRAAERLGPRIVVAGGMFVMTAGLALVALAPASTPVWALSGLMLVVGAAGPFIIPPTTAVLLSSLPDSQAGTASGVFNTSRQVGGALAVAVFGALLAGQDSLQAGLRASLLIAAAVALAAGLAARKMRPLDTDTDTALLEGLAA